MSTVRGRWAVVIASIVLLGCQSAPRSTMPPGGFSGYLCCNMHRSAEWISDNSHDTGEYSILPLGTPVRAVAYGNSRVQLDIDSKVYWLGNDYSRNIPMETFAKRYIVSGDPRQELAAMPAREREAIREGRIMRGMTRRQVAMALAWPVAVADPLAARRWTYWNAQGTEWHVNFDADGRVSDIDAGSAIRRAVWTD